ncbi:hypothetical protein SOVF_193590 [Spinacia oleracea]|nr:hypothetical protein SOVF_193590 [Spinacia oleracea]
MNRRLKGTGLVGRQRADRGSVEISGFNSSHYRATTTSISMDGQNGYSDFIGLIGGSRIDFGGY